MIRIELRRRRRSRAPWLAAGLLAVVLLLGGLYWLDQRFGLQGGWEERRRSEAVVPQRLRPVNQERRLSLWPRLPR